MSDADDVDELARNHLVRELTDRSPLAKQQARAYVLREVEGLPRDAAAAVMDISTSTLDHHLGRARQQLETARDTVRFLEDLESHDDADE